MNTFDLVVKLRTLNRAGKTGTDEYERLRADLLARDCNEVHAALDASDAVFDTVPRARQ